MVTVRKLILELGLTGDQDVKNKLTEVQRFASDLKVVLRELELQLRAFGNSIKGIGVPFVGGAVGTSPFVYTQAEKAETRMRQEKNQQAADQQRALEEQKLRVAQQQITIQQQMIQNTKDQMESIRQLATIAIGEKTAADITGQNLAQMALDSVQEKIDVVTATPAQIYKTEHRTGRKSHMVYNRSTKTYEPTEAHQRDLDRKAANIALLKQSKADIEALYPDINAAQQAGDTSTLNSLLKEIEEIRTAADIVTTEGLSIPAAAATQYAKEGLMPAADLAYLTSKGVPIVDPKRAAAQAAMGYTAPSGFDDPFEARVRELLIQSDEAKYGPLDKWGARPTQDFGQFLETSKEKHSLEILQDKIDQHYKDTFYADAPFEDPEAFIPKGLGKPPSGRIWNPAHEQTVKDFYSTAGMWGEMLTGAIGKDIEKFRRMGKNHPDYQMNLDFIRHEMETASESTKDLTLGNLPKGMTTLPAKQTLADLWQLAQYTQPQSPAQMLTNQQILSMQGLSTPPIHPIFNATLTPLPLTDQQKEINRLSGYYKQPENISRLIRMINIASGVETTDVIAHPELSASNVVKYVEQERERREITKDLNEKRQKYEDKLDRKELVESQGYNFRTFDERFPQVGEAMDKYDPFTLLDKGKNELIKKLLGGKKTGGLMRKLGFETEEDFMKRTGFDADAAKRLAEGLSDLEQESPEGKRIVNNVKVVLNNAIMGSTVIKDAVLKEVELSLRGLL